MSFYGKYLPLNFLQIVKQIGGVIVSSKRKPVENIELFQYIEPYKNYAFRWNIMFCLITIWNFNFELWYLARKISKTASTPGKNSFFQLGIDL